MMAKQKTHPVRSALWAWVLAFLPSLAFAAPCTQAELDAGMYEVLAPFGTISGCVDLTSYLDQVMQTAIGVAGILAVVMIVVCGIKLMTSGSAGGKSEAKGCITNAIFGVILAAGSWLILNTINPLLLKDTMTSMPSVSTTIVTPPAPGPGVAPFPTEPGWYFRYRDSTGSVRNSPRYATQESCASALNAKRSESGVTITNNPPPGPGQNAQATGRPECWNVLAPTQPANASEDAVRQALCGNNSCVNATPIGVNAAACRYDGDPGRCTNVAGLNGTTVSMVQALQAACGCNVIITGGTEYWKHSTHGRGSQVLDIRWDGDTTSLTNTIKSQNPTPRPSFSANQRWLYQGYWFTDEKSSVLHGGRRHWHVCQVGAPYTFCN